MSIVTLYMFCQLQGCMIFISLPHTWVVGFFFDAFFWIFVLEWQIKKMQILPHLFASGLLFFLCLRHCPSFSSSTHVAHLLSGVMDVFSVIRRTPHEFKIACLQVSVALCSGAWSHKTQWWTEILLCLSWYIEHVVDGIGEVGFCRANLGVLLTVFLLEPIFSLGWKNYKHWFMPTSSL